MVNLIKEESNRYENNGDKTKKWFLAWLVTILILIIQGLAVIGIGNLTWQFSQLCTKVEKIAEKNQEQDLCLKELMINQNHRIKRESTGK